MASQTRCIARLGRCTLALEQVGRIAARGTFGLCAVLILTLPGRTFGLDGEAPAGPALEDRFASGADGPHRVSHGVESDRFLDWMLDHLAGYVSPVASG